MSEPTTPSAYDGLTPQRRCFVDAYIGPANWNGAEAARQAGYSERSAKFSAHTLLSRPDVKAAITERLEQFAMPAAEVLARLTEQARALYAGFIDYDGTVDLKGLEAAGLMRLVKKISWDKNENRVIEFHDVQAALVQLGRYHALFTEKQEHSGPGGGPIQIREVIVEMTPDDPDPDEDAATEEPLEG